MDGLWPKSTPQLLCVRLFLYQAQRPWDAELLLKLSSERSVATCRSDLRDMALSGNIYFPRQNGHWLLGPNWGVTRRAAQLELWRQRTDGRWEFAQKYLNDCYYMLRYEDLCEKPRDTVSGLMKFLGMPDIEVEPLIEGIRDRGNIGRWRKVQKSELQTLAATSIEADLRQFGYET